MCYNSIMKGSVKYMVRVMETAPKQLKDIRKRVAREFTSGNISKVTFDVIDKHITDLEKEIAKIK